jgi:hypothetical protein
VDGRDKPGHDEQRTIINSANSSDLFDLQQGAALPTAIGVLWWLNGRECVLSSMIYRLAGGDRTTPDIFLPDCFARWIMTGSTALLAVAVGLVVWRQLAHRWRRSAGCLRRRYTG